MTLEERIENLVELVGDGDLYRYEASEIIFELAEEFAIGFVEWLLNEWVNDARWSIITNTKELLEIYKKDKVL